MIIGCIGVNGVHVSHKMTTVFPKPNTINGWGLVWEWGVLSLHGKVEPQP